MQRFVLLRGHQGAGKSYFAAQTIAQFQAGYPQAEIVHIENDRLLSDARGNYHWSPAALLAAQQQGQAMMRAACQRAAAAPQRPMLIINSNTNQNPAACRRLLAEAAAGGLQCEIYRLENFFPNLHGVDEAEVMAAYLRIRREALEGETAVAAVQDMSAAQRALLQAMQSIGESPLPYDKQRKSYISDDYLRLGQHRFNSIASLRYPDLRLLNCAAHILQSGRLDAAVMEMRGLVMDSRGHIILRPWPFLPDCRNLPIADEDILDALLLAEGDWGCCSYILLDARHAGQAPAHHRRILYADRFSLDNRRAERLREHCHAYAALLRRYPNHSFVFRIASAANKDGGAVSLFGIVETASGSHLPQDQVDALAAAYNIPRPQRLRGQSFAALKAYVQHARPAGLILFGAKQSRPLGRLLPPH